MDRIILAAERGGALPLSFDTAPRLARARLVWVGDTIAPGGAHGSAALSDAGFDVQVAAEGRDAITQLAGQHADLVLIEDRLDEPDAPALCRAIREELHLPAVPIIVLTADRALRRRAFLAGADDVVAPNPDPEPTSPEVPDEVVLRVATLLELRAQRDLLEEQRRVARLEERRWRLVLRIATQVGAASTLQDLSSRLVDALKDDLPVAGATFVFDEDRARAASLGAALADQGSMPVVRGDGALLVPLSSTRRPEGMLIVHPQAPPGGEPVFARDAVELFAWLAPHIGNAAARFLLGETRQALAAAKERLASLVMHDLKTPLGQVQRGLQAVQDAIAHRRGDDDGIAAAVEAPIAAAFAATEQLLRMFIDVLDIGRAEDGNLPFAPRETDLVAFVSHATALHRGALDRRRQQLVLELDDALPRVPIDEALVGRTLWSLLTNCTRFAPIGGRVEVSVTRDDGFALVAFGNDGPPIPTSAQARLFDRYGQTAANESSAPRGLGLYLCRLVAERHGGSIRVRDRLGGGVCFELRLPLPEVER